ncbi:MAG: glutamate--tRNA ligase [Methanomassiliicoccales archaeon]
MPAEEAEHTIRKYALQNAVLYDGKANPKAVVGKVLADRPDLKPRAKELVPLVHQVVEEVNRMGREEQRLLLEQMDPSLLTREKAERGSSLPDLPNVREGEVVMRFAPGPSGPLHIGHSRVAILNDEYVKRYGGTFITRMEDTNPEKIDPEAYRAIPEDLDWLGVDVHQTVLQSDRFETYYEVARQLVEIGKAYVCFCDVEEWRSLKGECRPCPHREVEAGTQLDELENMLNGHYSEGEAVLVVKTDLEHPNPAIRDFIGLRIVDHPHPRTGDRYSAYPMMNLSVAVDDYHLGLTHVLRGKDHLNNTLRQEYIFEYMGWERPWYHHYGFVSVPDAVLKTSKVREGIERGEYTGWDDPRLGTFRAMERRGLRPEAIRAYWVDCGMKDVDIQFSWQTLHAYNKEIVDPQADRFFMVWDPHLPLHIEGTDRLESKAPLHPDHPDRGMRRHIMHDPITLHITEKDASLLQEEGKVRLKDLCNVEFLSRDDSIRARYIGNDLSLLKEGARIIHWVPEDVRPCEVISEDHPVHPLRGLCEPLPPGEKGKVIQFERFGFVKVEEIEPVVRAVFSHR